MASNFDPPTVNPEDQVFSKKVGGRYVLNPPPPPRPGGDPNFAPFDPMEGDPALPPAERIKRGFEATRVINRDVPGYPGSFLYGGEPFQRSDERAMLRVPIASATYTPVPFKSPSYSREMAKALGAGDLDKEYDDKVVAWVKKTLGH